MALKIKVTKDNVAPGTELAFGDYFLAKVGEEVIVPDFVLTRYEQEQGVTLEEAFAKDDSISIKHATKKEAAEAWPDEEAAEAWPDEDDPEPFSEEGVLEEVGAETVNEVEGGES